MIHTYKYQDTIFCVQAVTHGVVHKKQYTQTHTFPYLTEANLISEVLNHISNANSIPEAVL